MLVRQRDWPDPHGYRPIFKFFPMKDHVNSTIKDTPPVTGLTMEQMIGMFPEMEDVVDDEKCWVEIPDILSIASL